MKNCTACKHSYMGPDEPLVCGHESLGLFGLSLLGSKSPRNPDGACVPDAKLFEQHPLRNVDGSLPNKE